MSSTKKSNAKQNIIELLKLIGPIILAGVLGGVIGAAFLKLLGWVAHTREHHGWLLLLLPVGGVATVLLFRLLRLKDHGGVNEIVKNIEEDQPVRARVAPLMFLCTAITHLFGGSAGKEGAALQLGGAGAAAMAKVFRIKGRAYAVLILSGMSAVFAGVFGTPLAAAFFVMEFKIACKRFPLAIAPCLISAIIADRVAGLIGIEKEITPFKESFGFDGMVAIKLLALGACICVVGAVMCHLFKMGKKLSKKWIENDLIRILIGSAAVILLTVSVGDMRYNGSGMEMALEAIGQDADWFDFLLKMVFTAVTLAAGFKGGEIVPTFCIGATFGCVMGTVLGLDPTLAAAVGLVALFSYATNSLVGAACLGLELFGFAAFPHVLLACLCSVLLSGKGGLFEGRVFKSPLYLIKNRSQ